MTRTHREPDRAVPRGILLVLVDDLRADAPGFAGNPAARTPFLDGLAARGVVHTNTRTVCGWTLPACASVITGRMPSDHGLVHHDRRFGKPKLPALLGPAWDTFGVGNNGNLVPDDLSDESLAALGFERRPEVWKRFGWQEGFGTYRWFHKEDKDGPFASFRAWHGSRPDASRPWFAMLHTNVVHDYDRGDPWCTDVIPWLGRPLHPGLVSFRDGPWVWKTPPEGTTTTQVDRECAAKYAACVAECDRRLAAALADVDLDSTLVFVVSDHGEGFDGATQRVHHCGRLHDDLLRVPLLVLYPPGTPGAPAPGTRIDAPASVLDVARTALAVAGAEAADELPGRDLRALPAERTLAAEDHGYLYLPPGPGCEPFRRYEYKSHDLRVTAEIRCAPGIATKRISARIDRVAWEEEYDLVSDPREFVNRTMGPPAPARPPVKDEGAVGAAWRDLRAGPPGPPVLDTAARWNRFAASVRKERRLPTSEDDAPGELPPISFVVAVDDPAELARHVLASAVWRRGRHEWIFVENRGNRAYRSIGRLYVEATRRTRHELVAYVHQDVYFLPDWERRFAGSLRTLRATHPAWGVLGAAGRAPERPDGAEPPNIGHWSDPHKYHPPEVPLPAEVQILDELLLVVRRDAGITFDPDLPGFHAYGADLCLAARERGRPSLVVDAPVVHKLFLPDGRVVGRNDHSAKIAARRTEAFRASFAESADYVRAKWRHRLPFRGTAHRFE